MNLSNIQTFLSVANHQSLSVAASMLYLSQPTEFGTLYSRSELEEISVLCRRHRICLYVDGARLAYALGCSENDVSLADLADLSDVFYIGGTKCGALFGEAVVIPQPGFIPHFFTVLKQNGALLAKGRITGLQFDTLFTDDLYTKIGRDAVRAADRIRNKLEEKHYVQAFPSPTNQIFIVLTPDEKSRLDRSVRTAFWEKLPDGRIVCRIAVSWAVTPQETDRLLAVL